MKSFLKIVLASIVGFFLSVFLLFIFFASIGSSGEKKTKIEANSVLSLNLVGSLPDQTLDDPFSSIDPFSGSFSSEPEIGLTELKDILENAAADDKIKGILLNTDQLGSMPANAHELRRALLKFKESGKFIYAYSNSLSEQSVMFNTAADKSYVNPMGYAEFNGVSTEIMYYTGLFEKIKLQPMIFYAGEFKSATEPYRLKAMSPENRIQVEAFLNGIYNNYLQVISDSKGLSIDSLRNLAAKLDVFLAEDAVKFGLVDALKYEQEVENEIKELLGYKEEDKLKTVSLQKYKDSMESKKDDKSKNKVAVIYAEGTIEDGKGGTGKIGGDAYVSLIRKVREDKDVKAIVLRVNSPGGSAFASELILNELRKAQENIPVVVSMGNLAASGGYYISSYADKIYAEPTTITGSIGVFGMFFNIGEALKSNLGITTDRVKTAPYADFGSATRQWDDLENAKMTAGIQKVYSIFLNHVSTGRKMSVEEVDKIARGRVWLGEDAVKIGLVDELGSIDQAIAKAAELAKIETYKTERYPEVKSTIDQIMEMISGNKEEETAKALKEFFGEEYSMVQELMQLKNQQGIQARMPYHLKIK
jgi:protease-4